MKRVGVLAAAALLAAAQQSRPHKIPPEDLKPRVIWGATCEVPDGPGLSFGGQDQEAEDGCSRTRIREGGGWKEIHDDLRARNPLQEWRDDFWKARTLLKDAAARERFLYFKGLPADEKVLRDRSDASARLCGNPADLRTLRDLGEYEAGQARRADEILKVVRRRGPTPVDVERICELLDAEPSPRALSPIVYDAATRLFVLFGGDHCDYLTNDTWVFDFAKRKWFQRHPPEAPPPRAHHVLKAAGDGKVVLSGGYTYTSNTDYCGSQYRDLDDGEWTYDVAADAWTGGGKAAPPGSRVYRTGRLHPDFYLEGPKPDPAPVAERLRELPSNTWVRMKPPHLPALNRDWGTAVLDPDRDLILRWSGGHSAHGGTDVLHYHLDTNRWELPNPVEFPLGQLYSNTSYPEGFNFNRRPWVTGHTYQSYGYDPNLGKMLFVGRTKHAYVYDPDIADWTGRFEKPGEMVYGDCYYTLTIGPTPKGLVCWTQAGRLFRFDAARREWVEIPLSGAKLPGSVVDNSTVVYDSRRDRLLFARKPYGDKHVFSGELHAADAKSGEVTALSPEGREAAAAIPYLCQIRYDAANDLFLVGATLPPGPDGLRRTPAYDPAANRWVSLRIGGEDPSGAKGRNVSLGLMYDQKRNLFWAVDARSEVFVLRLDPAAADLRPMR